MTTYLKVANDSGIANESMVLNFEPPAEDGFTYHAVEGTINWRNRPSVSHAIQWSNGNWSWVDSKDLDAHKEDKLAELNGAWRNADKTLFVYAGKEFQSDDDSLRKIQVVNGGVVLRGTLHEDFIGEWKAADDSYVPIPDVATWTEFYNSIETTIQSNFVKAQQLKEQVRNALNLEGVKKINW